MFNYTYVLCAYMRSLMIFLAVGDALDSRFTQDYQAQFRASADALQNKLETIRSGIVNVSAPTLKDLQALLDTGGPPQPHRRIWDVNGRPFGAVNIYSGASAVGGYSKFDQSLQNAADVNDTVGLLKFYAKYLVRTIGRSKEVYRQIGLPAAWRVVNNLRALAGDPPLPGPDFGDWSLREMFTLIGGGNTPILGGQQFAPLTARNLLGMFKSAPPNDAPNPKSSLRKWL